MYEKLDRLREACQNCRDCRLCETRRNIVFSDGVPNDRLMLIGEAPGYWEDMEGKPFVGKSGQLLDKILSSIGIAREKNIYICNTVKCRPPNNRIPSQEEQIICRKYLDAQIEIIRPKLILLCGAVAAKSFIDSGLGIMKIRGQWFDGPQGSRMMPIFHPAFLLRNGSRIEGGPKWLTWQDCQEIRREYDRLPTAETPS
ncbi:MAG: uracil-DNA glycosylase [Rickettsiales bacterium]|jgi:DNA polymerase|nr:uracil-DNA glycosylase [Rickettsiales bacterium]